MSRRTLTFPLSGASPKHSLQCWHKSNCHNYKYSIKNKQKYKQQSTSVCKNVVPVVPLYEATQTLAIKCRPPAPDHNTFSCTPRHEHLHFIHSVCTLQSVLKPCLPSCHQDSRAQLSQPVSTRLRHLSIQITKHFILSL